MVESSPSLRDRGCPRRGTRRPADGPNLGLDGPKLGPLRLVARSRQQGHDPLPEGDSHEWTDRVMPAVREQ